MGYSLEEIRLNNWDYDPATLQEAIDGPPPRSPDYVDPDDDIITGAQVYSSRVLGAMREFVSSGIGGVEAEDTSGVIRREFYVPILDPLTIRANCLVRRGLPELLSVAGVEATLPPFAQLVKNSGQTVLSATGPVRLEERLQLAPRQPEQPDVKILGAYYSMSKIV